jgi:hypothetical protein
VGDYGALNDLRALAFMPGNRLVGIRDGAIDELVSIDPSTGAVTLIGATGLGDIQGLTATDTGELYGTGVATAGPRLYRIDPLTGAGTVVGTITGGVAAGELQTIEWIGGTRAWIGRSMLWNVDLGTAAAALVGPFGVADVRGLAAVRRTCYADCDQNNALNVNDFICFQGAFAAGASYADCDQNSSLNVNDFVCFQSAFAAGCP